MNKELPTIKLFNHLYYQDFEKAELRGTLPPFNTIPFSKMDKVDSPTFGTYYRVLFDFVKGEPHQQDLSKNTLPSSVKYLEIPARQSSEDKRGLIRTLESQTPSTDNPTGPSTFQQSARDIPRYKICETEFHIDTMFSVLRQVNNLNNTIDFKHIVADPDLGIMGFEYNEKTKNVAGLSPKENPAFNQTVVMPMIDKLDPDMLQLIKTMTAHRPKEKPVNNHKPRKIDPPPDDKKKRKR